MNKFTTIIPIFNSNLLKIYIPLIDNNNNVQNEYYLTDSVKIIRDNLSIEIDILLKKN